MSRCSTNMHQMSLFPKHIHRIGFLNLKSHFSQNVFIGPESLSEIWSILEVGKIDFPKSEKLEKSVSQKVSGNCSHTFPLFFAPKTSPFFLILGVEKWVTLFQDFEKVGTTKNPREN